MSIDIFREKFEKAKVSAKPVEKINDSDSIFPIESLPTELKNICLAGYHAFKLPYEFFAVPGLVALSTAIGTKFELQINNSMKTKASLYACLIANAGSGKSPAMSIAFQPIHKYQSKQYEIYKEKYYKYIKLKEEYEIKKRDAKKDGNVLNEMPPEKPIPVDVFTTDATTEALASLLKDNPNGIVLKQDEFLRFYNSMDAYRNGKGGDRDFYLSLWNHEPIKINRKKEENIYIESPYVSIIGNMTPSGIETIAKDDNTENGFLDRFLFAYPTDLGMMSVTDKGIDEETERDYEKLIYSLFEYNDFAINTIRLDDEALSIYKQYDQQLTREAGTHEKKCSIFAKIRMYSLRFALIIHVCKNLNSDFTTYDKEVTAETMRKAIQLADYFRNQTNKIYSKLNESEADKQLKRAINILHKKLKDGKISKREFQQQIRMNGQALDEFIKFLMEKEIFIKSVEEEGKNGVKKIMLVVNPNILKQSIEV
jgi:hypothetical protein